MARIFAEWERAKIRERVMAGLARARVKGTKSGKPIGRAKISLTKEWGNQDLSAVVVGTVIRVRDQERGRKSA